jgi:hypothetical protein
LWQLNKSLGREGEPEPWPFATFVKVICGTDVTPTKARMIRFATWVRSHLNAHSLRSDILLFSAIMRRSLTSSSRSRTRRLATSPGSLTNTSGRSTTGNLASSTLRYLAMMRRRSNKQTRMLFLAAWRVERELNHFAAASLRSLTTRSSKIRRRWSSSAIPPTLTPRLRRASWRAHERCHSSSGNRFVVLLGMYGASGSHF